MVSTQENIRGLLPDPEILPLINESIYQNDGVGIQKIQQEAIKDNHTDIAIINDNHQRLKENEKNEKKEGEFQNDLGSSLPKLVEVNLNQHRFQVANMVEQHWDANELNQSSAWSNSVDSHISAAGGVKNQFSFLNSLNQMFNSSNKNNSISKEQSVFLDSGYFENSMQKLLLGQSSQNNQQQDEIMKQKKQLKPLGYLEAIEEVASFKKSFQTNSQNSKESQTIQENQSELAISQQKDNNSGKEKQKLFEFFKAIPGALSKIFEVNQQKLKDKIASCVVVTERSSNKQEDSHKNEETKQKKELKSEDHKTKIHQKRDVSFHLTTQESNQNQEHQVDSHTNRELTPPQSQSKLPSASDQPSQDQANSLLMQEVQKIEFHPQQAQEVLLTRSAGENTSKQLLDSPDKQNLVNSSIFSAHRSSFFEGFSVQKTKYFLQESQIKINHPRNNSLQHNRTETVSKISSRNSFRIHGTSVEQTKQRTLLTEPSNDVVLRQEKYPSRITPKILNIELSGTKLPLFQQNPLRKHHLTNPNVSSPLEFYSYDQQQSHQGLSNQQTFNKSERRGNDVLNLDQELIHYPGFSPHFQKNISSKNNESLNKSAYAPLHRQNYIFRQNPSQLQSSPIKGNTLLRKFLTCSNSPSLKFEKKNSSQLNMSSYNAKQSPHERRLSPFVSSFIDQKQEFIPNKTRLLSAQGKNKLSEIQRKQPESVVQSSKLKATNRPVEEDRQYMEKQKEQQQQQQQQQSSVLFDKNNIKVADMPKRRQIKVINRIIIS